MSKADYKIANHDFKMARIALVKAVINGKNPAPLKAKVRSLRKKVDEVALIASC